jgi:hypothetical protein
MTPTETYQHALEGIARLQVKLTDLPLGNSTLKNAVHGPIRNSGPGLGHPCMSVLAHSHFVNYGGERRDRRPTTAVDNTMLYYCKPYHQTYITLHFTTLYFTVLHTISTLPLNWQFVSESFHRVDTPDMQAAVTSFSFIIISLSLSPVSQVDITPTFTQSCSQLRYGRTSLRRTRCPGELKKVKKFQVAITKQLQSEERHYRLVIQIRSCGDCSE